MMLAKSNFLNFRIFDYNTKYANIEFLVLCVVSFSIPFLLSHPQLLVGSVVNALLFRASLSMDFKKSLPIIFLPSVAAYLGGVLFGGATSFLLYFIPVIWLSNASYVYFNKLLSHRLFSGSKFLRFGLNIILSSGLKSLILFVFAFLAVTFFSFPPLFLTVMGLFQFLTAIIGGFSAYFMTLGENKVLKNINKQN